MLRKLSQVSSAGRSPASAGPGRGLQLLWRRPRRRSWEAVQHRMEAEPPGHRCGTPPAAASLCHSTCGHGLVSTRDLSKPVAVSAVAHPWIPP